MITFESNNIGADSVVVDIVCDDDEGVFLSLSGTDDVDHTLRFDLVITDQSEIEAFFSEVDRVRKDFERLSGAVTS